MRLTKLKKGAEVLVRFLDHAEGFDKPITCVVRGKVISRGPKFVKLHTWTVEGEEANSNEENSTPVIIITSAIIGYAVLDPEWIGEPPV